MTRLKIPDTRGILDPAEFARRVRLQRYPSGAALAGVVEWFWAVRWDLPDGVEHSQQVLSHPAANVSVGPPDGADESGPIEARLYGVTLRLFPRTLRGRGWTVAARTTVGGLGALVDGRARELTDRVVALDDTLGLDGAALEREIDCADNGAGDVAGVDAEAARIDVLRAAVEGAVRPARLESAREVAAVARIAETERAVRRVAELAERAGVSERTLQRQFGEYVGVSPTWVLRRYRLIDAAEAVRDGAAVDWASLAAELGYSDQAHLIRDFRGAVGQTPEAYARAQRR